MVPSVAEVVEGADHVNEAGGEAASHLPLLKFSYKTRGLTITLWREEQGTDTSNTIPWRDTEIILDSKSVSKTVAII